LALNENLPTFAGMADAELASARSLGAAGTRTGRRYSQVWTQVVVVHGSVFVTLHQLFRG